MHVLFIGNNFAASSTAMVNQTRFTLSLKPEFSNIILVILVIFSKIINK